MFLQEFAKEEDTLKAGIDQGTTSLQLASTSAGKYEEPPSFDEMVLPELEFLMSRGNRDDVA